jgi:hypothetical protein
MKLLRVALACAALVASLTLAAPSGAAATLEYQATYVEPVGGPNQSPFTCPPGTSCGSASISGLGHAAYQIVEFNLCGFGCHHRTVYFADGSTLLIQIEDQPSGFAFTSPGNAGRAGYIGFPGLNGNPQFLEITETIIGGTGRFAGASGGGAGTVTARLTRGNPGGTSHRTRTSTRGHSSSLSSTVCQSARGRVSPSGNSGLRQITSA